MHPVNRVVSFFIFAFFLSHASSFQLVVYAATLLAFFLLMGNQIVVVSKLVFRLRWFFLSIIVLYVWLEPSGANAMKSGIFAAMMRILFLCAFIFAAYLFVIRIPRDQLMGCVYWLGYPCKWFGLSPERLALRTRLVVDAVGVLRTEFQVTSSGEKVAFMQRIRNLGSEAASWFSRIEQRSEAVKLESYELPAILAPRLKDWFFSLCFLAVLLVFSRLTASL